MGSRNSSRRNMANRDAENGSAGAAGNGADNGDDPDRNNGFVNPDLSAILSYLIQSGQVRILNSLGDLRDDEGYSEDEEEDYGVQPEHPPKVDPNPDTSYLDSFSHADCCTITSCYLPNHKETKAAYRNKAFCGTYSQDGNIFLSACQDKNIRIYDTARGRFKLLRTVRARDVGWSVLDTAFSPDGNHLVYSSWSECIHICSIYGEHEKHEALPLYPVTDNSFCIFSLCFSQDNNEILGGANDGYLYVYDVEKNVWDRRTLNEDQPQPVGTLAGHADGITFIDSKGTKQEVEKQNWDYRWQTHPARGLRHIKKIRGDSSLMTYRGHSILNTLIRCRFSPAHSTGQRYIYSGCATGAIVVYDVLTGKVEMRLKGHDACWDTTIGEWTYHYSESFNDSDLSQNDSHGHSNSGKDDLKDCRRSKSTHGLGQHGSRTLR
ncbi:hypothetical protein LSH36_224g01015 [Paralvinella palmiformis]|uniref:Uncharacterized protein n=1 Tax=Paralvinella palmiformis TaxID=53620 RepID=A0AAD9N5Q3_9ANNE|nr:hypothetical protein LSH36_224g01015 [Paralvinella palmiformis]